MEFATKGAWLSFSADPENREQFLGKIDRVFGLFVILSMSERRSPYSGRLQRIWGPIGELSRNAELLHAFGSVAPAPFQVRFVDMHSAALTLWISDKQWKLLPVDLSRGKHSPNCSRRLHCSDLLSEHWRIPLSPFRI